MDYQINLLFEPGRFVRWQDAVTAVESAGATENPAPQNAANGGHVFGIPGVDHWILRVPQNSEKHVDRAHAIVRWGLSLDETSYAVQSLHAFAQRLGAELFVPLADEYISEHTVEAIIRNYQEKWSVISALLGPRVADNSAGYYFSALQRKRELAHNRRVAFTDERLYRQVDELELSVRAANTLRCAGLKLVGDIVVLSAMQLSAACGASLKNTREITRELSKMGLSLGMKVES